MGKYVSKAVKSIATNRVSRQSSRGGKEKKKDKKRFEDRIHVVKHPFHSVYECHVCPEAELDDFEIEAEMAVTQHGKIYLVQSRKCGKYFALKMIRREKCWEHKFDREKQLIHAANCPFIIKGLFGFEDAVKFYIVMELAIYGDFGRYGNKPLPEQLVKLTAAQIVLALEYLQEVAVMHRDLVRENILIFHDGYIKLGDFGCAKRGKVAWTRVGTTHILPPEVINREKYGPAADWWALGIFIYEAVFGDHPFCLREWEPDDQQNAIKEKQLKFSVVTDANAPVRRLITQLLTKNQKRRLGTLSGGAEDVMQQEWFSDVNFVSLYNKKLPMTVNLEPLEKSLVRLYQPPSVSD